MKPKYFLCSELVKPIDDAIAEIDKIHLDASFLDKPYLVRGAFAYSMALFESSLNDFLKQYYLGFPEKITTDLEKTKIDDISYVFESTFAYEITELIIEDFIRSISFKNIDDILTRVEKTFDGKFQITYHKKELREIKERRNLLLHNNLVVDKTYRMKTGTNERIATTLSIPADYLDNSLTIIRSILSQISSFSNQFFAEFTDEKLIRGIWEYFFDGVLSFDQVSHVKGSQLDFYPSEKLEERKYSLSGSERTLMSLFLLNYNPEISQRYYASGSLNSQVGTGKLSELIELFDRFPLLLQRVH